MPVRGNRLAWAQETHAFWVTHMGAIWQISLNDPCAALLWQLVVVGCRVQLLSKPKYSGVEKIKTIGSTYMAAAGLLRHSTHRKVLQPLRLSQLKPQCRPLANVVLLTRVLIDACCTQMGRVNSGVTGQKLTEFMPDVDRSIIAVVNARINISIIRHVLECQRDK